MNIFEYSKEAYAAELARRSDLRTALGLPMGLSVVLAGAVFTLLGGFEWSAVELWLATLFGIASGMAVVSLGFGIYYLIRSHVGYEYAYIPTAKEVAQYRQDLLEYYGDESDVSKVDQEVEDYIAGECSENAHINSENNDRKSMYLHLANLALVSTLILVAICGALFLIAKFWR